MLQKLTQHRIVHLQPVLLFILVSLLWFLPHPALASVSPRLEAQILEVIREHPEVILESVMAYQEEQKAQREAAQQAMVQEISRTPQLAIADSPVTGSPEQRTVLIEFSDFQCPFCAQAHDTVDEFMARYGDEVTLVYKHFPLAQIHPEAIPAARAAYAAQQQGKFWAYYDALFTHQDQLGDDFYRETAAALDLDLEQFDRDRAQADAAIQADIQLGQQLSLTGTPAFILNGKLLSGAVPLETLEKLLD